MDVEHTPTQIVVRTARYRLEFYRAEDRWRHVLFVDGRPALESMESPPDDKVPASPAFQDLLVERRPDDTCEIQLFGQCGKQVYSAAVRCEEAAIHFDVSVRDRNASPVPARSSYRSLSAGARAEVEVGRCLTGEGTLQVQAISSVDSLTGSVPQRWSYFLLSN
jgi:hypothetical protein